MKKFIKSTTSIKCSETDTSASNNCRDIILSEIQDMIDSAYDDKNRFNLDETDIDSAYNSGYVKAEFDVLLYLRNFVEKL